MGLARTVLFLTIALDGHAAETLRGSIGTITGEDWAVSGLEVEVDLTGSSLAGTVHIGSLELKAAERTFTDIVVACGRVSLTGAEFACHDAALTIDLPGAGRRTFPGAGAYDRRSGAVRFEFRGVPLAEGRVDLRGTASESAVDIDFTGRELELAGLALVAAELGLAFDGVSAAGRVDLSGSFGTRDGALSRARVKAELSAASIANEPGTIVTDSAHGLADVAATRTAEGWRFTAELAADAGEAYVEPVYASMAGNPLTITANGTASDDFGMLELSAFTLRQGSVLDASGSLQIVVPQDESGKLEVDGAIELGESSVEALYTGLLQVMAAGTLLGDLETAGTVSGSIEIEGTRLAAADIDIHDLSADDRQGRLAIYGLNGSVHWPGPAGDAADAEISRFRWEGASAYNIPFGGSQFEARIGGDDLELLHPLRLPTMGGALLVERLSVSNFGTDDARGLLDADLEPIQLGQLTAAFGWPAFSGSLSGVLPLLQYEDGVMTVGGTLSARAFDGDIEFANLKLEQPFGLVPHLSGDLHLRQLDLELVTNTFSFGLIQGRLSGDVTGLEMLDWQPVAMDLHLYTPPGDSSRRRISQRAVENLANVGGGGGAAAALSSGFMKFFEVFAYDKIGIRCILQDGTCAMSGAGPAGRDQLGGGYYIVKGSGLPRIDVVGYRSQVSWSRLVRQLTEITKSGTPTVN
jgi:hypothetical protein